MTRPSTPRSPEVEAALQQCVTDLVPAKEFAFSAELHEEYVRELCRRGKLPAKRIRGRWYVDAVAYAASVGFGNRRQP